MLRLVNISKVYKVGNTNVHALNKVNISFRKNEFVSILGPSGSGKTTLLNIIGGLDQYTSGDLNICGISTKKFKDRDWDHYRNLRIGFIFQSYNLIPHQTVLANVELALTISGIKKEERIERAKKALNKVGLHDQYYKKPNQLSGGQCQRVAIARALVNDPEILLADEPTGALDTKTSIQIMDIIKEIAKDRLVIMVTHNPELAQNYSTRIINLRDGAIIDDSNPYSPQDEIKEVNELSEEQKNKQSKAKMSFPTAFRLSFRNLLSKLKRTLLVSIASSIGIIGVSAVLAVSFGVTDYTYGMQDDMLSSYPIKVSEEAVDISSLTEGLTTSDAKEAAKFDITTQIGMQSMIAYLMEKYTDVTNVRTNDINADLVEYINEMPDEYLSARKYDYGIDITNNIFTSMVAHKTDPKDPDVKEIISLNGLIQRYVSELKTVNNFGQYARFVNLFTNFMQQLPDNKDYILNQYDLLGNSRMAENEDEVVIVVDKDSTLTDLTLAQMGYYGHDEFINIAKRALAISDAKKIYDNSQKTPEDKKHYDDAVDKAKSDFPYKEIFNYEDLIGDTNKFTYIPSKTLWEDYGEITTDDVSFKGTVTAVSSTKVLDLSLQNFSSFYYLGGTSLPLGEGNKENVSYVKIDPTTKTIVPFGPDTDLDTLFNGFWVGLDLESIPLDFMEKTPEEQALIFKNLLTGSALGIEHNGDSQNCTILTIDTTTFMPTSFDPCTVTVCKPESEGNVTGFNYPAIAKPEWINNYSSLGGMKVKVVGILRAKEGVNFGSLSRGVYYTKALTQKYMANANDPECDIIHDENHGIEALFQNEKSASEQFKAYITYDYLDYTDELNPVGKKGYSFGINTSSASSITSLFSGLTGKSDYSDQNVGYLRSLSGLKAKIVSNDSQTNSRWEFNPLPQDISLYPKSFADKDKVTSYLDKWNADGDIIIKTGTITKDQRKALTYTDTVQLIISVINMLIRIVTVALVSFTSLSLIVSCFMIAVITYISVVERVKEIGVIRSLGGRKKDVARLFTAENLITGLSSGVIGVVITYLLSIILNGVIKIFGIPAIAALPWWMALIMILLSILLSVLSGFIPSRNASKQDPVNALRSE